MTDSQLLFGIMQNDDRVWRHIYRDMKFGFSSIIAQEFSYSKISNEDIDDIFQESLIVLMQKVKSGNVEVSREGALFSYLVEIGKRKTRNHLRKLRPIASDKVVTISLNRHKEEAEISTEDKQQEQDDFIDRVFDLLPAECKALLKYFYWERKSMDDIASILGMRNADSAKTKKSKCMNKFKDIAAQLIESDEFAEDAVRNAVERASLRELLKDEKFYADNNVRIVALDIDEDNTKR